MITRAQKNVYADTYARKSQPKLNALERSMLKWVTVDSADKVLDASIGSGLIGEYLRRNSLCEVCGVSDRMEDVRAARDRLQGCDVMYAAKGDIPWREATFDTVLLKAEEEESLLPTLKEVSRVLKQGGQLVLGVKSAPAVLESLLSTFSDGEGRTFLSRRTCEEILSKAGFRKLLWTRTGPFTAVVVAWTKNEAAEEMIRSGLQMAQ